MRRTKCMCACVCACTCVFVWTDVCVRSQDKGACVFIRRMCISINARVCVYGHACTCVVCVGLLVHGSSICWQWVAVQEKQAGLLVGNLSHNIEGKNKSCPSYAACGSR